MGTLIYLYWIYFKMILHTMDQKRLTNNIDKILNSRELLFDSGSLPPLSKIKDFLEDEEGYILVI